MLAQCTRTTAAEVVLDMEAGALMRIVFIGLILPYLVPGIAGLQMTRNAATSATSMAAVLKRAATDSKLKDRVLNEGAAAVAGIQGSFF